MNHGIPESFQDIRDIFVIHIDQMLKLDKKPPIYGVALLVAVACEVLANVLQDGPTQKKSSRAISPMGEHLGLLADFSTRHCATGSPIAMTPSRSSSGAQRFTWR